MSRRTDLLQQLLQSDKFGEEKENEQKFLAATAELILTDLINIATNGVLARGAGALVINLQNDSTTFMSGSDIERDLITAEREEDEEIIKFLRKLIEEVDENDWSKNVLITLISDAGTRTFTVEAGGAKKALERSQKNLADKLKAKGLKLPLYPTPQLIERAREVMGSIDFDPTSDPVQQVLVDATAVPSIEVNCLKEHWHGNVWVSPKGAVRDCRLWLNKTINEYRNGYINSFVFFCSASELLRAAPVIWDYPCVFLSNVSSNSGLLPMVLNQSPLLPGTYCSMVHR